MTANYARAPPARHLQILKMSEGEMRPTMKTPRQARPKQGQPWYKLQNAISPPGCPPAHPPSATCSPSCSAREAEWSRQVHTRLSARAQQQVPASAAGVCGLPLSMGNSCAHLSFGSLIAIHDAALSGLHCFTTKVPCSETRPLSHRELSPPPPPPPPPSTTLPQSQHATSAH